MPGSTRAIIHTHSHHHTVDGASSSSAGTARGGAARAAARASWPPGGGATALRGAARCVAGAARARHAGRGPAAVALTRWVAVRAGMVFGAACGGRVGARKKGMEKGLAHPPSSLSSSSHTRLLASEAITPKKSRARAHATTPTQLHPQNMLGTVTLGGRLAAPRASAPPSTSAPRGQASPARASLLRPPLNAPLRRAAPAARRGRAGLACRAMFERFTEVSGAGAGGVGVRGRGSVPRRTRLESRETFPFPLRPAPLWPARAFGGGGGGAVCELGGPRAEAAQPPLLACGATALAPAGRWGACEEGGAGRRAAPGNRAGLRRLPRTTRASVLASE